MEEHAELRHKLAQEQKGLCYVCKKHEWELSQPLLIHRTVSDDYTFENCILICQDCFEAVKDTSFEEYRKKRKKHERNFQEEYTPEGNQRLSVVPCRAVYDGRISSSQFRTFGALGVFGDRDGWCWPSLERLAKMLHKSKSAVCQDIKALEDFGYIAKAEQEYYNDGRKRPRKIRILFDTSDTLFSPAKQSLETVNPRDKQPLIPEINSVLIPEINENALSNATNNAIAPKNGAGAQSSKSKDKQPSEKALDLEGGGLDFLPSRVRPLAEAFIEVAGDALLPTKAERGKWRKFTNEWVSFGFTPELIREAVKTMRSGRVMLTIAGPQSITKVARSLQAQKQTTPGANVWHAGDPLE